MRFQILQAKVVEIKLGTITVEVAKNVHFHMRIPFEHLVKVGDLLPIEVVVPVKMERLKPKRIQ